MEQAESRSLEKGEQGLGFDVVTAGQALTQCPQSHECLLLSLVCMIKYCELRGRIHELPGEIRI